VFSQKIMMLMSTGDASGVIVTLPFVSHSRAAYLEKLVIGKQPPSIEIRATMSE
jgi:hypothetical protein